MPVTNYPRRRHQLRDPRRARPVRRAATPAAGAPAPAVQSLAENSPRPATASSSTTGAIAAPRASPSRASSEYEEWVEDLHELLARLDALPAYIGGSSSGCRLALLLARQRPEDVRGLLLWRVTGGAYAAERLTNQYYTSHIEAAEEGGMAAVCAMEHWSEVIKTNPKARAILMAMEPQDFIARMTRWRQSFCRRRRPSGDRPQPRRAALDDDAGLHRAGQRPGAPARCPARSRIA